MSDSGWTYFVQAEQGGPIKIGYTAQPPEQRLANLQTGSPAVLRFVGLMRGNRERELHAKFDGDRLHLEWFKPSVALTTFIRAEAQSALAQYTASRAQLKLEGSAVPIVAAIRPHAPDSMFEVVVANDGDILDLTKYADEFADALGLEACELLCDDEVCDCDYCTLYDAMLGSASAIEGKSFVESVGINVDAGLLGFLCGPCNNQSRFETLVELASVAASIDHITPHINTFALLWDAGRQVGIDLWALHVTGGKDNCHVFDPAVRFGVAAP